MVQQSQIIRLLKQTAKDSLQTEFLLKRTTKITNEHNYMWFMDLSFAVGFIRRDLENVLFNSIK